MTERWRKYTLIFVVATIVLIGIYDVLAISQGGTEASISHLLIEWSYNHPVFTFIMGFAMGHLFWRIRSTKRLNDLGTTVVEKVKNDIS
jgi:hypothetical protein